MALSDREILAYARRVIPKLQKLWGVERYRIDYQVQAEDPFPDDALGCPAGVELLPEYNRASLFLFPRHIESLEKLGECLRHEVIHLVLAQFNQFARVAELAAKEDTKPLLAELFRQTGELVVTSLEQTDLGKL